MCIRDSTHTHTHTQNSTIIMLFCRVAGLRHHTVSIGDWVYVSSYDSTRCMPTKRFNRPLPLFSSSLPDSSKPLLVVDLLSGYVQCSFFYFSPLYNILSVLSSLILLSIPLSIYFIPLHPPPKSTFPKSQFYHFPSLFVSLIHKVKPSIYNTFPLHHRKRWTSRPS